MRLCYDNEAWKPGVVVTTSGEVADRPGANILTKQRSKKWRSTTTSGDQWLVLDFGRTVTPKAVLLADVKVHAGGTLRIEYWTGSAWAWLVNPFTPTSPLTRVVPACYPGASYPTTKVRIYFTNTAAAPDYVEAGVVFVGAYLEPSRQVSDSLTYTRVDPSPIVTSLDGQASAVTRSRFYTVDGELRHVPTADKDALVAAFDQVGQRVPVFLAIDPANAGETFYGTFRPEMKAAYQFIDQWAVPIAFQEAR